MCFIDTPNLPKSKVAVVAVSIKHPKIIKALNKLNIQTILIKPCNKLSTPVNSHADMLCHHLGENKIIVARGEKYLTSELNNLGFKTFYSNKCIDKIYPYDVMLNAARIGDKLFACTKSLDNTIINYCKKNNISIIPVKQGYTKCSTVVINSNSLITEDISIAKAARKLNLDVLKIEPGYVSLKGYDYGFLGGACGMIGKNILAFTGNIKNHYNYTKIKTFCKNRNVLIISLTDGILSDVGGIIPLKI